MGSLVNWKLPYPIRAITNSPIMSLFFVENSMILFSIFFAVNEINKTRSVGTNSGIFNYRKTVFRIVLTEFGRLPNIAQKSRRVYNPLINGSYFKKKRLRSVDGNLLRVHIRQNRIYGSAIGSFEREVVMFLVRMVWL